MNILERLKSPVVIIQILSIIATLVITLIPDKEAYINAIALAATSIINVAAGLNNPTDKENF